MTSAVTFLFTGTPSLAIGNAFARGIGKLGVGAVTPNRFSSGTSFGRMLIDGLGAGDSTAYDSHGTDDSEGLTRAKSSGNPCRDPKLLLLSRNTLCETLPSTWAAITCANASDIRLSRA